MSHEYEANCAGCQRRCSCVCTSTPWVIHSVCHCSRRQRFNPALYLGYFHSLSLQADSSSTCARLKATTHLWQSCYTAVPDYKPLESSKHHLVLHTWPEHQNSWHCHISCQVASDIYPPFTFLWTWFVFCLLEPRLRSAWTTAAGWGGSGEMDGRPGVRGQVCGSSRHSNVPGKIFFVFFLQFLIM